MDWTAAVDAYCERTNESFWAEPLNAWSNLAFFAASVIGLSLWSLRGGRDRIGLILCLLVAVIGAGSFLFHTFATRWASLADIIPIALFIYIYFALALSRFFGFSWVAAGLGTAAFLAVSLISQPLLAPIAGSSAGYVPALLAMLVIGGILARQGGHAGPIVLGAGLTFLASLSLRTLDGPLCGVWPLGTHVFWHFLNAATLGLLLAAAIDAFPASDRRPFVAHS